MVYAVNVLSGKRDGLNKNSVNCYSASVPSTSTLHPRLCEQDMATFQCAPEYGDIPVRTLMLLQLSL